MKKLLIILTLSLLAVNAQARHSGWVVMEEGFGGTNGNYKQVTLYDNEVRFIFHGSSYGIEEPEGFVLLNDLLISPDS